MENQPFGSPNEKDVFMSKGTLEQERRYFLRSRKEGFEGFFGEVSRRLGMNVEKYKIGKRRKYYLQLTQEKVVWDVASRKHRSMGGVLRVTKSLGRGSL